MDAFGQMLLGIGVKAEQLRPEQAVLRAVVVYVVALAIVRLGKRRLLARATAFDVIVSIVIGSIAGRAVTGNAPFGPAFAGLAGIVAMHWIVSALALRWGFFGKVVKGRSTIIIRDGRLDEEALRSEHMTKDDLDEDLRQKGHPAVKGVAEGRLERSGQVSVLAEPKTARIVEIQVKAGVQTVRIEIS